MDWQPPSDDGGSEIISYLVDKYSGTDMDWNNVTSDCRETNFKATGLIAGVTYKFRIKAKNSADFMSKALESELVSIKGLSGMYKHQTVLLECVSLQIHEAGELL